MLTKSWKHNQDSEILAESGWHFFGTFLALFWHFFNVFGECIIKNNDFENLEVALFWHFLALFWHFLALF